MGGPCVFAVAAIVCAIAWLFGYLLVLLRRAFSLEYGQTTRDRLRRLVGDWRFWLTALMLVLAVCMLVPVPAVVPEAGRRGRCANNLKQIALAFDDYSRKHGSFLPAFSTDVNGKRLHSWRVLLLPYLEERSLYEQLRLDEPWDSPHNKALFDSAGTPSAFRCPSAPDSPEETNYVLVVGPGTISDGPNRVCTLDVADGAENTIMVVEMVSSGIHWAEPRDLKMEEMDFRINRSDDNGISSDHPGGANVAFCDGSIYFIDADISPELLKGLVTIAGGEDVEGFRDSFD